MALSREAYQELEDIVGSENISDDPAVLVSYAFTGGEAIEEEDMLEMQRKVGSVVLLPGSAEEVQDIVKTCNKYRIKFKAFSTGWGASGAPTTEGMVQLDLRRMNRILEIDKKNKVAVVEPYVLTATLQAEAMKVGLNCHMIGAGGGTSALANTIGVVGHGGDSIYMGHGSEALLAMEWVLPNGDIVRTGSAGSGCGWFSAEGPGPGLRGLIRGFQCPAGCLGVFTKASLKLAPWPGPAEFIVKDKPPAYKSPVPDNFRVYTLAFPSWQDSTNSYYKIWDSEIGYFIHRQYVKMGVDLAPAFWVMYATDPTQSLDNLEEWASRPEMKKLIEEMKINYQLILAGNSLRDIEYQEKVLDQILAETNGWKVARMSETDLQEFSFCYLIRMGHKNLNFAYTPAYGGGAFSQYGTPDIIAKQGPIQAEVTRKAQKTGHFVKCGDALMGCAGAMGGGGYCVNETFMFSYPGKETLKAHRAVTKEMLDTFHEKGFIGGGETFKAQGRAPTKEDRETLFLNTLRPAAFHWQWKIKQMLDPNDTGGLAYMALGKPPKSK